MSLAEIIPTVVVFLLVMLIVGQIVRRNRGGPDR